MRGVNLPPGTGGTPGGTGGGPEDSVDDSDPGVTPAGFPILETKSSMLTIASTSDNLIFTVSNHSSVRSAMELAHLLASMMDMDKRFSLSVGTYRREILLIISKKHWHKDALSLLASLIMLVSKSMRDNS